ncbi:type VII secretion integral membrane protein EccD [Dactylosporangium sucinum]|uniref:Type VII secretion integral membrane protein EccD n=1 Tax=Dactylosporangium sucinum TaxID=1424081 RepID=A0A917WI38_9ACTN|nr:type VII secretion integral membrane protein EccD [Dactylosporangium sucinum]GGM05717.1 type VII secretion integral membrane protein EccD [Dactylosporangium sucinum]
MATTTGGMSRVTIVAPKTRVDLALPSDVPLADLLPTVLRYAGDGLADDPAGRDGWVLSRLGGAPLAIDRSPLQLDVQDGEMLYLRPRGNEFTEPIFDDVVDAVATATQDRAGRWRPASTRRFGLTVGVIALALGVLMVLFSGPPQLPSALIGLGLAVLLLAVSSVLSRAFRNSRTGVVFGVVALGYAGVGGLLLLAGDRGLADLDPSDALVGGAALLLASAIATAGVASAVAVFLGTSLAAVALCIGALICMIWDASPSSAAAIVAALAFAALPAMPMLSYRMAGLPIPSVPTDAADLKTDTEMVAGRQVLALSERADEFLAGMLGALAVIGGLGSVIAAIDGGVPGACLAAVFGLVMVARARWFISRRQRIPLLVSGLIALAVVGVGAYASADQVLRLAVGVPATLAVAAGVIAYAMAGSQKRPSPMWGRTLDIFETVLILAIIPLAFWVAGLYGWIRTLREG